MIIFLQELSMQLFLWMLQLVDGVIDLFSAISGVSTVNYGGNEVNIVETAVNDPTVTSVFWCILVLSVGLVCIFTIVAIVQNMITSKRNTSAIVGKFFLALLGTIAVLLVVVLGILIANELLQLVADIFKLNTSTKLSTAIFNACVGEWNDGFSAADFDIDSVSVSDILGDYKTTLGIWPKSWKNNGMINPSSFYYFPSLIAGVALTIAMIIAVVNMAKRLFEIVYCYLVMPVAMSTLPLDDGARFKNWREMFVSKIILAFGTVLSVNVFTLLLPIITNMKISGMGSFGNALFLIALIIGGAMVIPAGQTMFARLFGQADDMHAGGGFLRSAYYGGRIVGGATVGLAFKGVKGAVHLGSKAVHRKKNGGDSSDGDDNTYTDESGGSAGSTESTETTESTESTDTGGTE
ncbi:MAG: hypothetical protein LUD27_06850 [Clostridia bacterium]|nr:hypothetical protein [Clostridia bacterium]